ncbi:cytochrome c oxidase subunit 6C-like [Chironomus tepperi]|uniref:cytochrome c oxidase subunit 6C-like n=1 Tax=Chironomus tepperi TaxID=113505 RepID=UPI00391F81BD
MSVAKPQLRGLLQNQIKKNLIISGVLVTALVVAVKVLRNDPKKRDYAEFYKNYDPEAAFQRMVAGGYMQCVEKRD